MAEHEALQNREKELASKQPASHSFSGQYYQKNLSTGPLSSRRSHIQQDAQVEHSSANLRQDFQQRISEVPVILSDERTLQYTPQLSTTASSAGQYPPYYMPSGRHIDPNISQHSADGAHSLLAGQQMTYLPSSSYAQSSSDMPNYVPNPSLHHSSAWNYLPLNNKPRETLSASGKGIHSSISRKKSLGLEHSYISTGNYFQQNHPQETLRASLSEMRPTAEEPPQSGALHHNDVERNAQVSIAPRGLMEIPTYQGGIQKPPHVTQPTPHIHYPYYQPVQDNRPDAPYTVGEHYGTFQPYGRVTYPQTNYGGHGQSNHLEYPSYSYGYAEHPRFSQPDRPHNLNNQSKISNPQPFQSTDPPSSDPSENQSSIDKKSIYQRRHLELVAHRLPETSNASALEEKKKSAHDQSISSFHPARVEVQRTSQSVALDNNRDHGLHLSPKESTLQSYSPESGRLENGQGEHIDRIKESVEVLETGSRKRVPQPAKKRIRSANRDELVFETTVEVQSSEKFGACLRKWRNAANCCFYDCSLGCRRPTHDKKSITRHIMKAHPAVEKPRDDA